MALTLVDMRASVRRNLGALSADTDAVNLDTADLNAIINEANHAIEAEKDWPWLQTSETINTVAGTYLYTPTTGWYRTKELFLPDWWELRVVAPGDIDNVWPTTSDRGLPTLFAVRAGQLDVRPVPDGVYALHHLYFRTEPDLVDDSDEPLLPNQFRGRLVDMATAMAAARLRVWAVSQYHQSKDAAWQRRMADDLRRSLGTKRVQVRSGTWDRGVG